MKSLHFIYHEIRPTPSRYSYAMAAADFEQQCRLFSRSQQECPAAQQFCPQLTFDDGHRSAVEYALPVLQKYGLQADFFITAGWTGKKAGYMGAVDLQTLQLAGMRIGAHGWSHTLLTHCDGAELDRELRNSKAMLEDLLGKSVTAMSLPGGRFNADVLRACQQAGYIEVFTSAPRVRDPEKPTFTTGRLNLRGDTSLEWVEQLLRPETGILTKLQRADKMKSAAKAILGDRLYANLWSLANRHETEPAEMEVPAA